MPDIRGPFVTLADALQTPNLPPTIKQQVTAASLLARPGGWDFTVSPTVLTQIPAAVLSHVTVEGFEWNDLQLGFGGVAQRIQPAVNNLRTAIRARGSELYAYAVIHKVDSSICLPVIGCVERSDRFRLIVVHSQVQLGAWAIFALAGLLLTVLIVYQYLTTGQSPALSDLQRFFGNTIAQVGSAGGTIAGGISQPFLVFLLAGGVAAILFARAEQGAGVKTGHRPKLPSGSLSVTPGTKGPVTAKIGT